MNRNRLEKLAATAQGVVGIAMLAGVLLSALALAANRPVSWSLLAIFVCFVFVFQVLLSIAGPVPLALRRAMLPGLLFVVALLWGWVQSTPGLFANWAHPFWSAVPDALPAISADPGQGQHAVMRLTCYVLIFVTMVWTCAAPARAGLVLMIIALFSAALAAFGLYAFATGSNPILQELTGSGIVQASFVNRNNYATYAGFGVLANLAAFLHLFGRRDDNLRNRLEGFFSGAWIFALGTLVCLGAVALTQSRAGAGAGLIGLAVFVLAWNGRRRGGGLVLPGVLIAVILFLGATSATGLLERLIATDSDEGRFIVYPAIVEGIGDRPWLGHGLGAFHEAFRPYLPLDAAIAEWIRAHNTYLEIAFGLGLPMAVLFFGAQALVIWRIWRGTIRRRSDRAFSCLALGVAAIAGFHSAFDFSLQMPAVAALYAAILGLGLAQSFTRDEVSGQVGHSRNARSRVRGTAKPVNKAQSTDAETAA